MPGFKGLLRFLVLVFLAGAVLIYFRFLKPPPPLEEKFVVEERLVELASTIGRLLKEGILPSLEGTTNNAASFRPRKV